MKRKLYKLRENSLNEEKIVYIKRKLNKLRENSLNEEKIV